MRIVSFAGAILLGFSLWAQSAAASTITQTIDFTAGDIVTAGGGLGAPVSPVSGRFTITFDPSLNYSDESSGIVMNFIDLNTTGWVPMFSYFTAPGLRQLSIGMSANGANGLGSGDNDFLLSLSYEQTPLFPATFAYAQDGFGSIFVANTVSVTLTPPLVAATPIPGSVLMLLTGLGAMGGIGFLRKRNAMASPDRAVA